MVGSLASHISNHRLSDALQIRLMTLAHRRGQYCPWSERKSFYPYTQSIRHGGPLMFMLVGKGGGSSEYTRADLHGLGYQLIVGPTTPFPAVYEVLRHLYSAMIVGHDDPLVIMAEGYADRQAKVQETIGPEKLSRAERRSVESDPCAHEN